MVPALTIARSAFLEMERELDRVAPNEGLLVPLVALRRNDPAANPCTPMSLADLREVLIVKVLVVPPGQQRNERARVQADAVAEEVVHRQVLALTRRFPRLRACAYLHSHPFARGRTWPSSGPAGDYEGHLRPLLAANERASLRTAFSFIACRAGEAPGWVLQGFALTPKREVVDLGLARVVADADPAISWALASGTRGRPNGSIAVRRLRAAVERRELRIEESELFEGWRRLVVRLGDERCFVALLPLDFPAAPGRYYLVTRGVTREVRPPSSARRGSLLAVLHQVLRRNAAPRPARRTP